MPAINKIKYFLVLALIILDQFSKFFALKYFSKIALINTDGSFSMAHGNINYVYISLFAICVFVLVIYYAQKQFLAKVSFTLIIAGAISNIIDRIRLGGVVDFLHLSFWPTFNIADSLITIGAILMLIDLICLKPNVKVS